MRIIKLTPNIKIILFTEKLFKRRKFFSYIIGKHNFKSDTYEEAFCRILGRYNKFR